MLESQSKIIYSFYILLTKLEKTFSDILSYRSLRYLTGALLGTWHAISSATPFRIATGCAFQGRSSEIHVIPSIDITSQVHANIVPPMNRIRIRILIAKRKKTLNIEFSHAITFHLLQQYFALLLCSVKQSRTALELAHGVVFTLNLLRLVQ